MVFANRYQRFRELLKKIGEDEASLEVSSSYEENAGYDRKYWHLAWLHDWTEEPPYQFWREIDVSWLDSEHRMTLYKAMRVRRRV